MVIRRTGIEDSCQARCVTTSFWQTQSSVMERVVLSSLLRDQRGSRAVSEMQNGNSSGIEWKALAGRVHKKCAQSVGFVVCRVTEKIICLRTKHSDHRQGFESCVKKTTRDSKVKVRSHQCSSRRQVRRPSRTRTVRWRRIARQTVAGGWSCEKERSRSRCE